MYNFHWAAKNYEDSSGTQYNCFCGPRNTGATGKWPVLGLYQVTAVHRILEEDRKEKRA
jgi:hypothetical protein